MQKYGALSKNTFRNPFEDFNALLIDTDKIVEFWCEPIKKDLQELLLAPTFFAQKMPFIIQGSRGTGKTMLFKYYSYEAQKIVAKSLKRSVIEHLKLCGGVGFYFRCDPPFINSLKAVCAGSSLEAWEDVFSYYMHMRISQSIIDLILDLGAEGELDLNEVERKIVDEVANVYETGEYKDFIELRQAAAREIKEIQNYKNSSVFMDEDIKIVRRFAAQPLTEILISCIKSAIQEISSINFVLMVDEYEALPPELQKSFNTMLKYANDRLIFRIGRRTERNTETATINETEYLRVNNDYLLVDLDNSTKGSETKDYFYRVAQKRINLVFKDVDIDIKQLFGDKEDLLEECKNNVGNRKNHIRQILKTCPLISKSTLEEVVSIIRYPDNPIMEMLNALWVIRSGEKDKCKAAQDARQAMRDYLDKADTPGARKYKHDYENKYRYTLTVLLCSTYKKNKLYYGFNTIVHLANGNTRLFINLCREIISDALFYDADDFLNSLSVPAAIQSDAIHKFSAKEFDDICSIIQYGDNIRHLILNLGNMFSEFHKDRKARYPETNQFILNRGELSDISSDTLNMALRWSIIVRKAVPQRLSLDINERGDIFYINRIFSPLFNISYRTRGGFNVALESKDFSRMCSGTTIPAAVDRILKTEVNKVLKTEVNGFTKQMSLFNESEGDH